jgi:integrase
MARPRTPIGTFGGFRFEKAASGLVYARTRYRDSDGRLRQIQASGRTQRAAERNLKEKLTRRVDQSNRAGEITADSPFPKLVELWLADLDLEDRLAANTRDLYEREMRNLVLPTFEHMTLREISVSRVDRFLKSQAKISYSRAKQAKVVLSLALGLAVRYEAITRNPVLSASRLRKPQSTPMSLSNAQVQAIRTAVKTWRTGRGLSGPKPDGQLGPIIEVMLGTSARIGEVLAIRKCDVDATSQPATVSICGTIISPKGKPTYRQDHPKTSKSRRTVAVPTFTAEALRQRLVIVADEDDEHLLFFSRNHTPLTTNNVRRRLRSIMDEAKIKGVTPHAFRRTVATVLDRSGGTDLAAEMLGHSSPEITRAHYIEKDEKVNPITAEILEQLSPEQDDLER